MVEESKDRSDMLKKHFNKELVITNEDNSDDFENCSKCWIFVNDCIDIDVIVRDHFQITGKCRGSAHRDCNINIKLNHKFPVVFWNLKNYDSHLIMQDLGKFSLKINVIPNGLEKYMSFSINNKLSFIDTSQFLSSSLECLVKNLNKDGTKYLSQEFDNKVLDLVNIWSSYRNIIVIYDIVIVIYDIIWSRYRSEYMSNFKKFKRELTCKENFYRSLKGKNISDKGYKHVLKVWNKFDMKTMKDYHDLYLKRDVLLSADVFQKLLNNSL